jgi:hypothetical protein
MAGFMPFGAVPPFLRLLGGGPAPALVVPNPAPIVLIPGAPPPTQATDPAFNAAQTTVDTVMDILLSGLGPPPVAGSPSAPVAPPSAPVFMTGPVKIVVAVCVLAAIALAWLVNRGRPNRPTFGRRTRRTL